jgi:hypothetical protein
MGVLVVYGIRGRRLIEGVWEHSAEEVIGRDGEIEENEMSRACRKA